jgi:phosphatidylserine/phosphatidylglycerophosphate/cardiolipin synthase-like enzyme
MRYLENTEIYEVVVLDMLQNARSSVRIATANVKDLQVARGKRYVSILKVLKDLCSKGVCVQILHSGIPSEPFMADFGLYGLGKEANFSMRRCLRVHFKCVVVDDSKLFFGSPNLTGAGMGAKAKNRRNFEIGVITTDASIKEKMNALFEEIWNGKMCGQCGRKKVCYVPLEEPS